MTPSLSVPAPRGSLAPRRCARPGLTSWCWRRPVRSARCGGGITTGFICTPTATIPACPGCRCRRTIRPIHRAAQMVAYLESYAARFRDQAGLQHQGLAPPARWRAMACRYVARGDFGAGRGGGDRHCGRALPSVLAGNRISIRARSFTAATIEIRRYLRRQTARWWLASAIPATSSALDLADAFVLSTWRYRVLLNLVARIARLSRFCPGRSRTGGCARGWSNSSTRRCYGSRSVASKNADSRAVRLRGNGRWSRRTDACR